MTGVLAIRRVPCLQPISIAIGSVDPHFKLTRDELREAVTRAAKIWEDIEGRDLFTIGDSGTVPINVVYDERQKTEEELQKLNVTISEGLERHEALSERYEQAHETYRIANGEYEKHRAGFMVKNEHYSRQVDATENNPSATAEDYQSLREQRAKLEVELEALKKEQAEVERLRAIVNKIVDEEKDLVPEINETITAYGDAAGERGDEFETGVYHSGADGQTINLYIYTDTDQLTRLLTHEMGHALGLGHVSDEQAIMYRLNVSKKVEATDADKQAIHELCRWSDVKGWPRLIFERIQSFFA